MSLTQVRNSATFMRRLRGAAGLADDQLGLEHDLLVGVPAGRVALLQQQLGRDPAELVGGLPHRAEGTAAAAENSMSSYPISATSVGTLIPACSSTRSTPSASRSFAQKIASGRPSASSRPAASCPDRAFIAPTATSRIASGRARRRAAPQRALAAVGALPQHHRPGDERDRAAPATSSSPAASSPPATSSTATEHWLARGVGWSSSTTGTSRSRSRSAVSPSSPTGVSRTPRTRCSANTRRLRCSRSADSPDDDSSTA